MRQAPETPAQGAFTLRMEIKLIDKLDRLRRSFAEREGFAPSRSEFVAAIVKRYIDGRAGDVVGWGDVRPPAHRNQRRTPA